MIDRTGWYRGSEHGGQLGRTLLGSVITVLILGWILRHVGPGSIVGAIARISPRYRALLLAVGLLPLLAWGLALGLIFEGIGISVGRPRAVALFVASVFLNNVTPFGQLGGDPPSAVLIAQVTDSPFEHGLAGITSLNALNHLMVVILGSIGGVWVVARFESVAVPRLGIGLAIGITMAVVAIVVLLSRRRQTVVGTISSGLAALTTATAGAVPLMTPPAKEAVEARVRGFVVSIERLAADPGRLLAVLVLGLVGHLAVAMTLWLALAAIGARVSMGLVLLVLPTAKLGGLAPTPGGAGSSMALVAGLLVAATDLPLIVTTGAALLYRIVAFWLPTFLGGGLAAMMVLSVESTSID